MIILLRGESESRKNMKATVLLLSLLLAVSVVAAAKKKIVVNSDEEVDIEGIGGGGYVWNGIVSDTFKSHRRSPRSPR